MHNLLLLSAYDGLSHQYWRTGLVDYLAAAAPEFAVTVVTLPARHFSWRQRGNSLSFAMKEELQRDFDLVIATSMTDLSALRGLNRQIAGVPALVYFHENQFAYPDQVPQGLLERQLTSIYTAISGDWLFFNSRYNFETFIEGAGQLLARMPDHVPKGIAALIQQKSSLVPVALELLETLNKNISGNPLRIVWNHRWEHDKGPARLKEIVEGLLASGCDFRFSLLGQQFGTHPWEFDQIVAVLEAAGRLGELGFKEDRQAYLNSLANHDVVLSTAEQEFQGLAVQEAIACGCVPVVPNALCYPEYVPSQLRYDSAGEAVDILRQAVSMKPLDLSEYGWEHVGPLWLDRLKQMISEKVMRHTDTYQKFP